MPITSERRFFYISYPLQAAALLAVLVPFLRYNNLLEWDFPGHYTAIWYLKTHLLPWPSGWNPYFYCGYPQGVFYPPLAHYLAALLACLLGLGLAIKGLVAASVLLLPITFYVFARRLGLDDLRAAVCSTWMTALLFLSGELFDVWSFGSDLRSILNVGLFANTLSFPVLFAFLAACGNRIERENWKWSAALLGALVLLHPLTSLVAGLFVVSLAAAQLWQREQQPSAWKPLVLTTAVSFLLSALWILPFLAFRSYMNPESVGAQWSPVIQFIVFNGLILAVATFSKVMLRPLVLTYIVLSNFIFIGTMWRLELQLTRLTFYLMLLIPIFLLSWMRSKVIVLGAGLLAIVVGSYGYDHSGIVPRGVPDFSLPDFGPVAGRIISVAPASHLPSLHVNHDLIPVRTGNQAVLGLFIESSLNGRFLGNLVRALDPDAYVWGTPTEVVRPEFLGKDYPEYIRDRLRLFDIQYIYTDLKLEDMLDPGLARTRRYINSYPAPTLKSPSEVENLRRRYHVRGDQLDFYLYPMGPGAVAEALPYVPKAPGSDWKLTNRRWFLETRGIPIFTDRPAPAGVRGAHPGERVELVSSSDRMDQLVLQIHAAQPIPVLVKVGYFPTWQLTLDGKPSQVYRCSPNLILIFGQGRAVLTYQRPWQEYAGLVLSALGLLLICYRNARIKPPSSVSEEMASPL